MVVDISRSQLPASTAGDLLTSAFRLKIMKQIKKMKNFINSPIWPKTSIGRILKFSNLKKLIKKGLL
jgi:hypothetical protein